MKMNLKKKGLIFLWISLFVFFTNLVFFVIGCHTHRLVKMPWFIGTIILLVLSIAAIGFSIYLMVKHRKCKAKKKIVAWIICVLVGLYSLGCTTFLFLLYGPYNGFRDWLVTTAMGTMTHQYYCEWFYNDKMIAKVLASNYIDDKGAETDSSLINQTETIEYDPTQDPNAGKEVLEDVEKTALDYEKQILERAPGSLYKILTFREDKCTYYVAVVYDPSRISVGYTSMLNKRGQYITDMAREQNAILAINGGAYKSGTAGAVPVGVTISNGQVISNRKVPADKRVIGFDNHNNLVLKQGGDANQLVSEGVRDAVTMGPFLIINGQASYISGNGGLGRASRTVIGQRKDGIVLMLTVKGSEHRIYGASMNNVIDVMKRYGAINAANLDGGNSTALVVHNKFVSNPYNKTIEEVTRKVATIFKVI